MTWEVSQKYPLPHVFIKGYELLQTIHVLPWISLESGKLVIYVSLTMVCLIKLFIVAYLFMLCTIILWLPPSGRSLWPPCAAVYPPIYNIAPPLCHNCYLHLLVSQWKPNRCPHMAAFTWAFYDHALSEPLFHIIGALLSFNCAAPIIGL